MKPVDWGYINIDDFYNRVRMELFNTPKGLLDDALIDAPEKALQAELYIKRIVPKWQELDDKKFATFESCIVIQTSIYFESYIKSKQVRSKKTPAVTVEYSTSGNIKDTSLTLTDKLYSLLETLKDQKKGKFIGFMVT